MNFLYVTLFFNIVAGIVQIFMKSWNQLLYPRVIEFCRLPLDRQRSTVTSVFNVIVNAHQVSLFLPEFMTFPERTKQMGKVKYKEQLDLLNKEGLG